MTDEQALRWFGTDHLRDDLKPTVEAYRKLVEALVATFPASAERTIAIRFLEQSKDYAVRAHVLLVGPKA